MMCGLFVCVEDTDTWLQKKPPQDGFIPRSLTAHGKSRAQLPDHNERQPYLIGRSDRLDHACVAPTEISVTIGVER